MAIDVEAVCAEWVRMGGEVRGEQLRSPVAELGNQIAAFVRADRVAIYDTEADWHASRSVTDHDEAMAALPGLARAYGLTPEPEVIPWEEAGVLWVEWGGVSLPAEPLRAATLGRVADRAGNPYVWVDATNNAWWSVVKAAADGSRYRDSCGVTLTRDTLEDMAEACGLPRTPGRAEAETVSTVTPVTADSFREAAASMTSPVHPRCRSVIAPVVEHDDRIDALRYALTTWRNGHVEPAEPPKTAPVDQYAERNAPLKARLDEFCGVS